MVFCSSLLREASRVINALNSNLASRTRKRNDPVMIPKLDYQASSRDRFFFGLSGPMALPGYCSLP
jgi:hypothetical protein